MEALGQIFLDCQHSITSQPKLIKKIITLYLKSDFKKFVEEFTRLLKCALVYGDKQPAVERTLSFVVKFATAEKTEQNAGKEKDSEGEDEEEADPFLENLILFLLRNHEANNGAVRLRICQLLSMLLRQMGAKAVIDNDLYDYIYEAMLHRLQDKIPGVRREAVLALTRLQDPYSRECPVIEAYCFHLCKDPNYDVRRAVLNNIAITYQTLPAILDRTRDVRELVRCQAYMMISQKIHLKSLTIAQRVRLLSEGLKDRHEMVRNTVKKKLIPSWLRLLDGNVLDLLTCLDVEASVKEAELVLKTIFELIPLPDLVKNIGLTKPERLITPTDLQPESALLWRCLCQHLREEGAEEALEEILPDLTQFCSYLSGFVLTEVNGGEDEQDALIQVMQREFITNQLISIVLVYDLSDEAGRRSLDQMVRNLLVSDKIGESLVKGLVEVFSKLHSLSTRINQLAEIISEIREPLCKTVEVPMTEEEERKKKLKVAGLKVKINQVREELQKNVLSLDLEKAQLQKDELLELEAQLSQPYQPEPSTEEMTQEPRNDSATLIKCLTIFCNIVECSQVEELTPALQTLHDGLVLGCLRSEDPAVRNSGVQALGLLCLLSKDLAKQHITLLMQVSKIDVEKIQLTALHCIIDCLHLYGIEEFAEVAGDLPQTPLVEVPEKDVREECVEDGGAIIAALCDRLDDESLEIRTLVVEGLCKLLLSSRITSSKLLSRLILTFYNPATGDDSFVRHILGVFFPLYASEDGSNQESLCEAVMPTLQTLLHAPAHSPLASVDVENVTSFLISITSPTILSEESQEKINVHDTLVFTLCSEVLTNPTGYLAKVFIRCLNSLILTPTNFSTLRQLDVLVTKVIKVIEGKSSQNSMKRLQQKIQDFLSSAPDGEVSEDITATKDETTEEETKDGEPSTDKTDTPTIRRKRMLYDQTVTDPALFSCEGDSETEGRSPSKRIARSPSIDSVDDDSVTFGSSVITSTQIKTVEPEAQVESSETSAVPASSEIDTELELSQTEEVFSEGQVKSSQQECTVAASKEIPSSGDGRSLEDSIERESSEELEFSSEEEPIPAKVPHLIISSHGTSKRSRKVLVEDSTSDSGEFNEAGRGRRKIKSAPEHHCSISSSNNSFDSRSQQAQKPVDPGSNSSRKRRKNAPSDLSTSVFSSAMSSDGSISDSSATRTTRSKSKGTSGSSSIPNSPASSSSWCTATQSLNTSGEESTSSRVMRTRHSKKSETPQSTDKLQIPNLREQKTLSSRRSSRNRKSK